MTHVAAATRTPRTPAAGPQGRRRGSAPAGRTCEQILADLPDLEQEGIPRATSFMLCVPPIR